MATDLTTPAAPVPQSNISVGNGMTGTVSGKGTETTTTGNTQVRGFGKLTPTQAFSIAKKAAAAAGSTFPDFTACIACFEGGYLSSPMSKRANNPFGQTVTAKQAAIVTRGERIKARPLIIGSTNGADKQGHAIYASLEDAMKEHVDRWGSLYVPEDAAATVNSMVPKYNEQSLHGLPKGEYWKREMLSMYNRYSGKKAEAVDPPLSTLTNEPLVASEPPATVGNTDPHGPTVVKNTNDSAKGMFTFPGVGAMVWVFFREGNPLFPVYFAASYSSSEWKSAYGGNSLNPDGTNQGTVGSQVSNSLKLNPNAGGGLEFTHVKNVNDPTGSSDTAVAMIYGDDGSNMMFSKGYHQIYTRNDRRDQIDGHIYSIIGGAEEKWIEDDSSLNVKGNVTIKIGKIDAESMNAMKELSDFSKQMNDTLMSNAGTPPPPEAAAPPAPPTDAGAAQSGIDDLKADKFANSTVPPEPEKPWAANKSVGEGTGPTIQNAANLKTATASGGGTQRLTTDTPEKIAQRQQYNSPEGQQQRAEKRAQMREEYKASKG